MTSTTKKQLFALFIAVIFFIAACLLFPRVLAFAELAARELRYFWWLILILALGVWLAFFTGRSRRD
ncbi:hypothetical protein CMV30_06230 [Nibricoccus aquaticus]|uniref:Uncharacterized protein n=1 Tax=Nibricoccus aquaticus TaxID=2576891 RepID=A0A290Q571_9BACT|nr:hypothetical protein [Nibricoccus aquaticus]ATC63583.1 hypothetical protein CMV30_06230 [Nibricoccus aquaticus]